MTLCLGGDDVRALATHEVAMAAAWDVLAAQRDGRAVVPPRIDVDLAAGFLRVMPAALDAVMGLKVMTLVRGLGTRYLILLYSQETGELLAAVDADEVTRLRTAATTAVAGELLLPGGAAELGLIGSGFEAEGHLRAFARTWPLERVRVHSPSQARREAFAARMSEQLGIAVEAVDSPAEAVAAAPVTVLATKAGEPVVDGATFPAGGVVLSIGSTRPDLRELDRATLARAAVLLVDDAQQVRRESGDVIDGLDAGALPQERILAMPDAEPDALARTDERDLLVFKSVGTALQDLALSAAVLAAAQRQGRGRPLGELTRLKPFAAPSAGAAA